MKKLTQLGFRYKTDKAYFHLFTEFYNDYFEKMKPVNILEIGILNGSSILMLRDFFPDATIYAVDINPNSVNLDLGKGVNKYICSQDDFERLKILFNNIKFDIIIDDGSHMTSHQQKSLGFFFRYLNEKGIYICEDLHTSYNKSYIDTTITTMEMIENYKKTFKINSDVLNETDKNYLNEHISELILYQRKENALMCYNCGEYNLDKKETCVCNVNLSSSDRSITSIFIKT
jgi:ubiquinone/menaquinone biosynthesis C-methylase UbiE